MNSENELEKLQRWIDCVFKKYPNIENTYLEDPHVALYGLTPLDLILTHMEDLTYKNEQLASLLQIVEGLLRKLDAQIGYLTSDSDVASFNITVKEALTKLRTSSKLGDKT